MFLKVGFLFSGMGWCFPESVFHFRTTVVPTAAIYFGAQAFSHMGFGRKKEKRCKFEITKEALWYVGGSKVMRWLATCESCANNCEIGCGTRITLIIFWQK